MRARVFSSPVLSATRRSVLSRVAISRAGAIAAITGTRPLRLVLPITFRLGLLVGGASAIGVGVATTISTGLGPGPFDVLVTGIAGRTGLSFALSLWLLAAVLGLVSTLLGRRPGIGTAIAPMIIGPMIDVLAGPLGSLRPEVMDHPVEYLALGGLHLLGVATIGVGAGAMIISGLGAGTGDLLANATSSKLGRSMPLVRTALEISFVGFGLILGGTVGVGTLLVAVTIGLAVRLGTGLVDGLIARFSSAVAGAAGHDSTVARSLFQLRGLR